MTLKIKLLFLILGSAFTSLGQDSLSVEQAVAIALKNNFDVLIGQKQIEIAEKNNKWSEAGLYPTVTIQVGQNNIIQDNTNNPFTFTPGVILNQNFSPTIGANVNLFSGFAVKINKQRLEQLQAQSEGNYMVVIESLISDVMRTYYSALLQKERMTLFKNIMGNAQRRLKYAEIKNQYGGNNTLELMQLKNQYLTDSTNYLLQELSYNNSLRNLVLLMNNDDKEDASLPVLSGTLDAPLAAIDEQNAKRELASNNQNLKNQFIGIELQKTNTEFQRSFLYPTLGLSLGVSPSFGRFTQLSGGNPNGPSSINVPSLSYSGNLNLRYNVFNNWKAQRAVQVAKIQEEIAMYNLEKLKKSLSTNLTNQLNLYAIRSSLVNVSTENLNYATQAYDLAQKRFELGSINSIDLLVFQANYQNTLLQQYENLYNRLDTYLEIYRMTGKLQMGE